MTPIEATRVLIHALLKKNCVGILHVQLKCLWVVWHILFWSAAVDHVLGKTCPRTVLLMSGVRSRLLGVFYMFHNAI